MCFFVCFYLSVRCMSLTLYLFCNFLTLRKISQPLLTFKILGLVVNIFCLERKRNMKVFAQIMRGEAEMKIHGALVPLATELDNSWKLQLPNSYCIQCLPGAYSETIKLGFKQNHGEKILSIHDSSCSH